MSRENVLWRNDWYDMDGNHELISDNHLEFGSVVCDLCYTTAGPIMKCPKCKTDCCEACSKWKRDKSGLIKSYCGHCRGRMGIVT